MGDENNNSQQELKIHMDSLFDFSSRVPYQKSHIISTLQAAKSNPEDLFGSSASKWADLAFGPTENKK